MFLESPTHQNAKSVNTMQKSIIDFTSQVGYTRYRPSMEQMQKSIIDFCSILGLYQV